MSICCAEVIRVSSSEKKILVTLSSRAAESVISRSEAVR